MKMFKRLVPAFAMLLTSAVMLTTASFAWFSMNTTVTATGMSVKAEVKDGLLISNAEDGEYSNSAEATNKSATLSPVTTKDFETWYTASSTKATDGQAISSAGYVEIDGTTLVPEKYYLVNSFWLKTALEAGSLTVEIDSIIVEGVENSGKLDACARIAFVTGTDIFVYAPVVNEDSDKAPGYEATWTVISGTSTASTITATITSTPTEVKVFAYFEGEDKSCRSENVVATLDTVKLGFTFSVVESTD